MLVMTWQKDYQASASRNLSSSSCTYAERNGAYTAGQYGWPVSDAAVCLQLVWSLCIQVTHFSTGFNL